MKAYSRRQQLVKRPMPVRRPQEIDTRTPSGRTLPY